MAFATNIYPSYLTWFGVAREPVAGTGVNPLVSIPTDQSTFEPEDKPVWLDDKAIRGSMADLYNVVQGVELASWSLGGPFYYDVHGFMLDNLFGDKQDTAATTATSTTTTTLVSPGSTSVTVTVATGFTTGSYAQLGNATITTAPVEIVGPITVAGSVISWTNPARFTHAIGAAAAGVTESGTNLITHVFSALNIGTGQPPTDTFCDYTGITPSHGARLYAGSCVATMDLTISAEKLVTVKFGATSVASAAAATAVTNAPTSVIPVAAWNGTAMLGNRGGGGYASVTDFGEVTYAFKRPLKAYFTEDGSQSPLVIARGPLSVTGGIKYDPAVDETALTNMLLNVQPSMKLTVTDSTAIPAVSPAHNLIVQTSQAAFKTAKINRSAVLLGYDVTFECVANTADAGGSGGLSPANVTLANYFAAY
jgi:hypothetical protein